MHRASRRQPHDRSHLVNRDQILSLSSREPLQFNLRPRGAYHDHIQGRADCNTLWFRLYEFAARASLYIDAYVALAAARSHCSCGLGASEVERWVHLQLVVVSYVEDACACVCDCVAACVTVYESCLASSAGGHAWGL